jgi:hypothetical protein
MTPKRYFSNQMFSPYFQSDHYQNESPQSKLEKKIENGLKKIWRLFLLKRK